VFVDVANSLDTPIILGTSFYLAMLSFFEAFQIATKIPYLDLLIPNLLEHFPFLLSLVNALT
jgi:hypothetical protein